MSKRTINFEDGPNGTPPAGPQTMAELLNKAESLWRAGEKQAAFVTVLGGIAMASAGIAQAIKASDELKARLDALEKK